MVADSWPSDARRSWSSANKPDCRVSSRAEASPPSPSARALLEGCPIAAALIAIGPPARLAAVNPPWRSLWREHDPDLAAANGLPLDRLLAASVDAAGSAALRAAVGDGRPVDLLLAVDRLGPSVLRAWGCRLDDHYLLVLDQLADPDGLASGWKLPAGAFDPATEFRYTAALAADGSWRITAAVPDFRGVLGLADATEGWLGRAASGDRRALRSRHLRLLAGTAQSLRYAVELEDGRRLTLDDTAVPVRHPLSDEVIGLLGHVRLAAAAPGAAPSDTAVDRAATARPPARPADRLDAVVDGLAAVGTAALVLAAEGRILAANRPAAALLDEARERLLAADAAGLLFADAATARDHLGRALDRDAAAPVVEVVLAAPGPRSGVQAGPPLRCRLWPLVLEGDRLVLATLAAEAASEARFRDALYFDDVTGLANRYLCLDRLRQNIGRAAAMDGRLAVLVLAVARWSLLERSFGRTTAEALLAAVAERLTAAIGELDTAATLGDARFAVIAARLASTDDAARIAQSLLDQLRTPVRVGEREIGLGGAIGIAVYPTDGETAETLLAHAEAALDRLPAGQEGGYQFYNSAMTAASSDRLLLEQQLLRAVEGHEFLLLYQPQISFASSRIVGMEALIRWRHPELGMVPPAEFIPLAEETGVIVQIGEWVLETACLELQRWFAAGVAPLRLAINISGRQYNDPNLVAGIRRTLEATGFPPHLLELELTESVIMEDVVDAARRLGDLHALGINLAVDDFGTGYSSLSYLKRFPIRSLKVDRSFVRDIAHNEASAAIARAIIAFGSALGLKVIAEGVESHDQYDILRSSGCDELQGYLFSRPVPAEDAKKLATERRHLPLVRA